MERQQQRDRASAAKRWRGSRREMLSSSKEIERQKQRDGEAAARAREADRLQSSSSSKAERWRWSNCGIAKWWDAATSTLLAAVTSIALHRDEYLEHHLASAQGTRHL